MYLQFEKLKVSPPRVGVGGRELNHVAEFGVRFTDTVKSNLKFLSERKT